MFRRHEGAMQKLMQAIAPVIATYVERQVAPLRARLAELEARPSGVPWKGVWGANESYPAGVFVTHGGSLWHAESASIGVRPGTDPNRWTLAVKRGADGKDAR